MVRIVQYVREEVVVHVSSHVRRRGIVGAVQVEPNSTSSVKVTVLPPRCD